ncbi:MAG: thioredoxin domain-containing protein [Bacteroidota bacterium]
MRHTFYLLLCLFTLSLTAQDAAGGMVFQEKAFDDLLAQAKAEDKIIFIDAYTTWCGPCKMMAAKVFPQEKVGKVYNEKFINAKFDMEKGEGPGLAERYAVMAYPTYLFVDGNGDIVHKGIGYIPAADFLALAEAASGPESLGALNKRYDGGERDPTFMASYIQTLTDLYEQDKAAKVTSSFLETQEDWSDPAILDMIIANPGAPGSKTMNYLLDNAEVAIEKQGSGSFMQGMQRKLITKYIQDAGVRALPPLEKMQAFYAENAPQIKERLTNHYAMFRAQQMREMDNYIGSAIKYFEKFPSNEAQELNGIAWDIFENSEDEGQLEAGLKLAKASIEIEAGYPNMDTLAWLYHKTGDQENAEKTAKEAIEMAKEMGIDYSDTAKILEK